MFSLLPWKKVRSIYDLSGAGLAALGVRFLMADLDNTLCAYSDTEPGNALMAWKEDLAAHGVTLFLLSNSRKPWRPARFAEALGIDYLGHAGKPGVQSFQVAMEDHGVTPEECAMVGDQIFTDILGANRAGVRSILVKPISLKGNPGRYLRYWAECPMRALAAGRKLPQEKGA